MKKIIIVMISIAIFMVVAGLLAIYLGDNGDDPEPSFVSNETEREEGALDDDVQISEDETSDQSSEDGFSEDREVFGFEANQQIDGETDQQVAESETCEEKEKSRADEADQQGREYYEGRIIASFNENVTDEQAVAVVELYGYRPDQAQVRTFNQNKFFTVYVDRGEEFQAICNLKSEDMVRNATVDYQYNLVL
jgi:hypothetical protein